MREGNRKYTLICLAFLVMLARPGEIFGAWPDDPEVNVPICTAGGTQEHPRIVTDGESGAIIVWQDIAASSSDIYAQRVDARGVVRWVTDGVAICLEKGNQWFPNLVYDDSGGAIMAWWDERNGPTDIYAQRINGDGVVQWQPGGIPVCGAPKAQLEFNIIADGAGGAIIAWHDYRDESGTPYIYAQRINAAGNILWERDGVNVSGKTFYQKYPTLASDGAGGAIIAWQGWRDGKGNIYGQRIGADGQLMWQKYGLPICKMPERQWHPAVVADGAGGAIIVWMDHRNDVEDEIISRSEDQSSAGWDIYAQRVNAQGEPQWQENGVPICLAQGDQYDYSVMSNGTDGMLITWHDQRDGNWDIYAQKLDASGNAEWAKDGLPVCVESGDQFNPNMTVDGAGGIIITWWDKREFYADIYAQRIDPDGNFLWTEKGAAICLAPATQQDSYPVNSGVGNAIIVWWDKRKADPDIYAQRVVSE